MNDDEIKKQVLNHLAEERIPSLQDGWTAMQSKFLANDTAKPRPRRFRLGYAILILLSIGVAASFLYFSTPQGTALAQTLTRFFFKSSSDERPLPPGEPVENKLFTPTPVPTVVTGLQPIPTNVPPKKSDPSDTVGMPLSFRSDADDNPIPFELLTLDSLPAGYRRTDLIVKAETASVTQIFKYEPYWAGELFVLTQSQDAGAEEVGESALIETLTVGETEMEKVEGGWFHFVDTEVEKWAENELNPTYRWQKDGYTFTLLLYIGDTFSPAHLDEDEVTALLELLLGQRQTLPEKVDLGNLRSIEEIRQAVPFPILAPTLIPEGYAFSYGRYESDVQRVIMWFQPQIGGRASTNADLLIMQHLKSSSDQPIIFDGYPAGAIQKVKVGKYPATLVQGEMLNGIFDPEGGISIWWSTDTLQISVRMRYSSMYETRLSAEDLLTLAQTME